MGGAVAKIQSVYYRATGKETSRRHSSMVDLILRHPSTEELESPVSRVSSLSLALLVFSCVAGGPFGIEVAVQNGGAFATIVALAAAGIFWGLPQALATSELAGLLPENGGQVIWTLHALGPKWAFLTGWLLVFNQVVDLCLYPQLAVSYFVQLVPVGSAWAVYALQLVLLLLVVALNTIGVEALSTSALFLTALIMAPFIALPAVAASNGAGFEWSALGPAATPATWDSQLAVFISTILWCQQGWGEVGALAGEVDNPAVVFPRGMSMAASLVLVAYSAPVVFGVALQPDLSQWDDGFLATLAHNIAPWLGGFMLVSAALANISTFLTSMAAYSRTLQAVARQGMFPEFVARVLSRNMTKHQTPVPAIALLSLTTCILMAGFQFQQLVVVDSTFFLLANVIVMVSFLRLKYSQPNALRPYVFPFGKTGAWLATASISSLATFAMYALIDGNWPIALGIACAVVVLFGFGFLYERNIKAAEEFERQLDEPLNGEGEHDDDDNGLGPVKGVVEQRPSGSHRPSAVTSIEYLTITDIDPDSGAATQVSTNVPKYRIRAPTGLTKSQSTQDLEAAANTPLMYRDDSEYSIGTSSSTTFNAGGNRQ
jgi:amino acid transporter